MFHRHRGLTLLELLLAFGIITTLMAMSLPGLPGLFQQQHGQHVLESTASAIRAARSAAVTGSTQVTICPTMDAVGCSGDWNDGLIAFVDPHGTRQAPEADMIVHMVQWPELSGSISWRTFGNRQYLQIDSLGQLLDQNGNFTWCPDNGDNRLNHQLVVNRSGRLRLARDHNGDGFRQDSQGQAIDCSD